MTTTHCYAKNAHPMLQEKLHDGSYKVFSIKRHDGTLHHLPKPVEYQATCTRLAREDTSKEWKTSADKWSIVIGGECFEYYTGKGLRKKGKPTKPALGDVLYALVLDASACEDSFEDWCSNYGYDTDSRKALDTYLDCQENAHRLRKAGIHIGDELSEFFSQY